MAVPTAYAPAPGDRVRGTVPFGTLALAYAVAIVYASVAFSRYGFNFEPLPIAETWRAFVAMPYLDHGSDQRQDWMANLMMLAGLGFLTAGALARGGRLAPGKALLATLVCVVFVLAVKFVQLWFPPRTVTINYVLAQGAGSVLGIAGYRLASGRLQDLLQAFAAGTGQALTGLLALHCALLLAFLLFPFDFTLSGADLADRLAALPAILTGLPFPDRPAPLRLALIVASTLMMVPFGMFLRRVMAHASIPTLHLVGAAAVALVFAASLLVMNAAPTFLALGYRMLGVAAGIHLMAWVARGGLARAEPWLVRLAPLAVLPYVIVVLGAKGLLTGHWLSMSEALAQYDWRGLPPFWHMYLGAKTQALRSLLAHGVLFAPIGLMVALWIGRRRRHALAAASIAAGFAVAIEIARAFRPGFAADVLTIPIIAAASAAAAAMAGAWLWRVIARPDEALPEDARLPVPGAILAPAPEPPTAEEVEPPETPLPPTLLSIPGGILAALCVGAMVAILAAHPLAPWTLLALLALYAVHLWRRPADWLVLLPAAIASCDLLPWTGWLLLAEADLFVLATVAVLALRRRPRIEDLMPRGVARLALTLYAAVNLLGVAIGLGTAAEPFAASANPYLHPLNALRASKGLWVALLLLPFLIHDWRLDRRTPLRLAQGFTLALALVVLGALVERLQFTGLLDLVSDYRIVSTFVGMHLGGSQIGIFLVLAMPFAVVPLLRGGSATRVAAMLLLAAAAYTLVVTYARAAYAAAILALFVISIATLVAGRRPARGGPAGGAARALPFAVLAIGLASVGFASLGSGFMLDRFRGTGGDFEARIANWTDGLAIRDRDVGTLLLGMGSGTFPRLNTLRGPIGQTPGDYRLASEDGRRFLSLIASSVVYLGQKIPARADRGYELTALWRSIDGKGRLNVSLCEKLVLYALHCTTAGFAPPAGDGWVRATAILAPHVLAGSGPAWLPSRPFDLSFWNDVPGSQIDVAEIALRDPAGRDLVANGDFRDGMARWYPSDDRHVPWRMENEYVASFFDGGLLRLSVLLLLLAVATAGATRLVAHGSVAGPAVLAALLAFIACCVFDTPLQAPRLATLFHLIAFAGLLGVAEAVALPTSQPPSPRRRRRRVHGRPDPRGGATRGR
jgi:VanZ family protein